MAFRRYDHDRSGVLDSAEFERVCQDMGFDTVSNKLFESLDHDDSGFVAYHEVISLVEKEAPPDVETKQLLMSMMHSFDDATKEESSRSLLDCSGWAIHATDVSSVQQELQALLRQSGCPVSDLIMLFDQDAAIELSIDDVEFHTASELHPQPRHAGGSWGVAGNIELL